MQRQNIGCLANFKYEFELKDGFEVNAVAKTAKKATKKGKKKK